MVFNVGTLVQPTTKATLNSITLPRNLYSHSDQTQQWQSSDPNGGGTGWGGRINDIIAALNTGALPPGITVNGGNALFLSGPITKGVNFSNADSFGLETFGSEAAMDARVDSLQRLLTFDSGLKLVSAANGVLADSFRSAQEINAALDSAPPLPVAFPNSGLGQQLAQVAQIISVRGALGMNRQIFFAGMGGFDNHEDLVNKHQGLMATFDAAVSAFFTRSTRWASMQPGHAVHRKRVQPHRQRQRQPRHRSRLGRSSPRARRRGSRRPDLRHVPDAPAVAARTMRAIAATGFRRRRSISTRRRWAAGSACRMRSGSDLPESAELPGENVGICLRH